jgi:hypothetical protein
MLAVGAIGAAEVDDGPRLEAAAAVAGLEPLAAAEAADAAWTLATARVRLGLLSEGGRPREAEVLVAEGPRAAPPGAPADPEVVDALEALAARPDGARFDTGGKRVP